MPSRNPRNDDTYYELEVPAGLETVSKNELLTLAGNSMLYNVRQCKGAVQFSYSGDPEHLFQLRTVVAVYRVLHFAIPRPKALLGHEHLQRLLRVISTTLQLHGDAEYHSLYISAAGSNSSVMQRIKQEIASQTGLLIAEDGGDLFLRIRRVKTGWEVLVRMTPRPLATRTWRIQDMQGALNGPTAQAMVQLTDPSPDDDFINLACGSGTLLIERAEFGTCRTVIGIDNNSNALAVAQRNIAAAEMRHIQLICGDARESPLANQSATVICADLPFGQLVGSHRENAMLYPAILQEAARIATTKARFVFITHEIRLTESILQNQTTWQVDRTIKIDQRGLHPRIFLLRKNE